MCLRTHPSSYTIVSGVSGGRRGQHLLVSHSIIFSSALPHLVWVLLSILLPSSGGLFFPQPSVFFHCAPVSIVVI